MGYKRTVHCSYCAGAGHNRMGCDQYKAKIEAYRANIGDHHWQVAAYDDKKARMANAKNNRSCSYCGVAGHARSGCTKMKTAKKQFRIKNVEYRENFLKVLIDNGIGRGAMLKYNTNTRGEVLGIITKIHWGKIHMANKVQDIIQFIPVNNVAKIANEDWHMCTHLSKDMLKDDYGISWEIAVAAGPSAILKDCPKSFIGGKKVKGELIAGKLGIADVFRDKNLSLCTMKDSWGDFDNDFVLNSYNTELTTT